MERDGKVFGTASPGFSILRDGYAGAAKAMIDAQKVAEDRRSVQLAQRLTTKPSGPILIRNARVFDSVTATMSPTPMMILISGNQIVAVGEGVAVPRAERVIDAGGKTVIPGLRDMHVHLQGDVDGLMNIAAGVTT